MRDKRGNNGLKRLAYIGHYTDESRIGIRTVCIDCASGDMAVVGTVQIDNAIWMAQNSDGSVLYSTFDDGLVAYKASADGGLVEFSRLRLEGLTAPCHAALSSDGMHLAWAEYRNGVAGCVSLAVDGSFIRDSLKMVRHEGRGQSSPRQDSPHAHCVQFSPEGKYLFAVDLGLDEVKVYDVSTFAEISGRTLHVASGSGPRHLAFHPSGKWAAVDFELENRVALYRYHDGTFDECVNISTLPEDYSGPSQCAAVKFSEDGQELYVSNRGHDSLVVFAVDAEAGTFARRAILPLGGSFPRDFAFAPGGNMLVACLKKSGIVRTYAYDRATCRLEPLADLAGLHCPLFVMFKKG